MRRSLLTMFMAAAVLGGSQGTASALTVPFTEEFATTVSNWRNSNNSELLTFVASGGPDGSSYASGQINYFGFSNPFGGGATVFRGQQSGGASGGAFVGNWLAGGVHEVSIWVRQNTTENLTFFLRIATAGNFPGATYNSSTVVVPNTWTLVTFATDPASPCFPEFPPPGGTCADALAIVGNVQFGTNVPASLAALDQSFTLDLDKVSIPEPGTLLLLASGLLGFAGISRRRG